MCAIDIDEASWSAKYVVCLGLYNNLNRAWQDCQDSNQLTIKYNQMKKYNRFHIFNPFYFMIVSLLVIENYL